MVSEHYDTWKVAVYGVLSSYGDTTRCYFGLEHYFLGILPMFIGILRDTGFFTLLCVLGTPRCDLNVRRRSLYIVVGGY
jgi:hypothetical protein